MKFLLAIGAGAGALYLLSRSARRKGDLGGLGESNEGVMGSPFFVKCEFDQEAFEDTMDLFSGRKNGRRDAIASASTCRWGCVDDREVKAAQFRNRENPEEWAILAKSAKGDGGWQMNWFDARGPRGDSPRRTQCEALAELSSGFRHQGSTMFVDGEVMSDWYLEEWQ